MQKNFNENDLNNLISDRQTIRKKLLNLEKIYTVKQKINCIEFRQFIHRNFHSLFRIHSFHSKYSNFRSILNEQPIRQVLRQRFICFLLDTYTLMDCGFRLTYAKFRLHLRLFYFRLLSLKQSPN